MRITSADVLEFEDVKGLIRRFIASPLGAAELERAKPLRDRTALAEILADTAEALDYERSVERMQRAARGGAARIRFGEIPDCREALAKLHIEGAVLDGREIHEITLLLESALEIRQTLSSAGDNFPRLASRAREIGEFRPLLRSLSGKILPDGSLADDASVALRRLRRDRERQQRRIQESLERFLRTHRQEGVLQEEFITFRNERFVVPIVSGQLSHVNGVVHGASGTGRTLFLEPLETIGLNNELVQITEAVLREEHRILREFTGHLREIFDDINGSARIIGEFEFLFAKARFAIEFDGIIPRFSPSDERRLALVDARHPLLEDVLRRLHKPVVPISVTLAGEERTLLISGPNTGGKTVSLKTVGLLALMAQAGFPVPCAEAVFPLFDEVLADIGDNQSIAESLSTFSAHIMSVRSMIDEVSPDSLVLLDELGRATDPEEGGALGVAVLEHFRASGAFTFASTHLLALKVYGANTDGVLNASMGFNDETLEPTYQLRIGAPGKSAGLDIAGRLGLSASLIAQARRNMSDRERDLTLYLNQLHERLERVSSLERELSEKKRDLEERLQNLSAEWSRREGARLADLERRVEEEIANFEAKAGETIDTIEREAGERKSASHARRKVARARREFQEQIQEIVGGSAPAAPAGGRFEVGATVRLRGVRQTGRISRILAKDLLEVEAGFLKLKVGKEDVLEILPPSEVKSRLPKNVTLEPGPKAYVTTHELNIIGRRAEEAQEEVDKFLDSAVLGEVDRVRIIHGHGMGVLRKTVAELLAANPNIAKFYPASPAEGGTGATIAELK